MADRGWRIEATISFTLIVFLAAATVAFAETQPAGGVYRLGILEPTAPAPAERQPLPLRVLAALRRLGYVEGQGLMVEHRYAEGNLDRLPALARDLVGRRVDAIIAIGNLAVFAAKDATTKIPIIMVTANDPAGADISRSLARPTGNVTGVMIAAGGTLAGKRLELLKEIVPHAARIGILAPDDPSTEPQIREAERAAAVIGVALVVVHVRGGNYDQAFAQLAAGRPSALFVLGSTFFARDRKRIIELAAKHDMPAMYEWREHVLDGGLMSYGSSLRWIADRVAAHIDRIFKGATPAELPIEQPDKFELVINLKTANRLRLNIPQSVLVRADEVIE